MNAHKLACWLLKQPGSSKAACAGMTRPVSPRDASLYRLKPNFHGMASCGHNIGAAVICALNIHMHVVTGPGLPSQHRAWAMLRQSRATQGHLALGFKASGMQPLSLRTQQYEYIQSLTVTVVWIWAGLDCPSQHFSKT